MANRHAFSLLRSCLACRSSCVRWVCDLTTFERSGRSKKKDKDSSFFQPPKKTRIFGLHIKNVRLCIFFRAHCVQVVITMAASSSSSSSSSASAIKAWNEDTDYARAKVFADNTNRVFRDLLKPGSAHHDAVVASIQNSTLYCEHEIPRIPADAPRVTTRIEVVNLDLIACARRLIDEGLCATPLVHNMSSDRHAGGGVENGRKAAEESACRRSTLFMSLDRYYRGQFAKQEKGKKAKIKDWYATNGGMAADELSYNPDVLVFRDVDNVQLTEDKYWPVCFVSSHAIRRPAIDTQDDRYMAKAIDAKTMKNKYRALLRLASWRGHRSLVLSGWGSGAFRIPPRHMTEIIFDLLFLDPEFVGAFDHVFFAIIDTYLSTSNFPVYKEALDEYQLAHGTASLALQDTSGTSSSSFASSAAAASVMGNETMDTDSPPPPQQQQLTKNQKRHLRKKMLAKLNAQ